MKRIAFAVLLAAVTAAGATPSIAQSTAVPTRDISVGELKLRAPVTGSDGESVGVINRISASSDGKAWFAYGTPAFVCNAILGGTDQVGPFCQGY